MNETAWIWLARALGAAAGSAISLAYILPQGRREAAVRFAVGLVSGVVFGGSVGLKISEEFGLGSALGHFELMLMGSATASLCAWWALGFVMRLFERSERKFKPSEGR